MDKDKKLTGSGVRNAAVIGGITGGLFGANAPIIYPETVKHANDTVTYINSAIPIPIRAGEESTIMASGGYSTLAGAGLGTLGGAAAYYLLKGLGKGGKAVAKKVINSRAAGQGQIINQAVNSPNIKANNS